MNNLYNRMYPSLYRGVVEDNNDPKKLGRCKIRVPSVHGELTYPRDLLPWARPLVLSPVSSKRDSSGNIINSRGSVNIPDVGSIVWIFFEGSDREFPVYLGGTYATGEINIDNNIVDFYIEDDNKISYDREKGTYSITIGANKIVVSRESINLIGNTIINGDLSIKGNNTIEGDLKVTGDLSVGGVIHINGTPDSDNPSTDVIATKDYINTLVGDIGKVLQSISEKHEDIIRVQRELLSTDSLSEREE